jgi:hypothetical protein
MATRRRLSGCYAPDGELACYIQCQDCLTFRVGSIATLLGPGMDRYELAREVTNHLRAIRN